MLGCYEIIFWDHEDEKVSSYDDIFVFVWRHIGERVGEIVDCTVMNALEEIQSNAKLHGLGDESNNLKNNENNERKKPKGCSNKYSTILINYNKSITCYRKIKSVSSDQYKNLSISFVTLISQLSSTF